MSTTPPDCQTLQAAPGRARRIARRLFLWFRIVVLTFFLTVVVLGLYLNKVGLPEFIKERVVRELREKGWDIQFSRLRLRWYRGFVAEHLQLQRTNLSFGPRLFVEEAETRLRHSALKEFRLEVDSVLLTGGRLIWPLAVTNQHRHTFLLDDVGGELMFRTQDRWELRSLRARGFGAGLELTGSVDHASAIRDWKLPRSAGAATRSAEIWLHRLENVAQKLQFSRAPEITGTFHGDALDVKSFQADLQLKVEGIDSPWGTATNIFLSGRLIPALHSNETARAELALGARAARTPWGETEKFQLQVQFDAPFALPAPTNARLTVELNTPQTRWGKAQRLLMTARFDPSGTNALFRQAELKAFAEQLHSEWGQASHAQLTLQAVQPLTNLTPASISAELGLDQSETRWGNAEKVHLQLATVLPSTSQLGRTNLAWPDRLENTPFESTATLTQLRGPKLQAETVSLVTEWRSPRFQLQVSGKIGEGDLSAKVELNSTNRDLVFDGFSTVDPGRISALLTTNAQLWMAKYSWQSPPRFDGRGRVTLPAWTNRQPDWRGEVLPTLSVAGQFQVGAGAYRGVDFTSARSPLTFSNLIWRIPELQVSCLEGDLEGDYTSDTRTRNFHWRLLSRINPKAVKPLFEKEAQQRVFDFFEFTVPPVIEAEIWANWLDLDRLGVVAQAVATNFTFRGETVQDCATRFQYTNKFLAFLDPQLRRLGEHGAAPGVGIDLASQKLYLTNASGNLDPQAIARAISKRAAQAIEAYQFGSAPTGRVYGVVDLKRQRNQHDLHFEVAGGPFDWKLFRLQQIAGNIHWVGEVLTLNNVQGALHGGRAAGSARFDFAPEQGADFSFNAAIAEVNLPSLAADLKNRTNKLEGLLSGELYVTRANSADWKSWQGHGLVKLHDGLIWDIPLFGVFSPVLNLFIPGLGNSRARDGTANFVITNSVIHAHDLDIRATAMRMHFDGAIDFERHVDGRMEAELLRDVPAIGFFISKIFWPVTKLFEYKVTGTLDQPKTEPLYTLPKLLLMPFHPIRTLKELFQLDEKGPAENKSSTQ